MTIPPAFSILFRSSILLGLWSSESAIARKTNRWTLRHLPQVARNQITWIQWETVWTKLSCTVMQSDQGLKCIGWLDIMSIWGTKWCQILHLDLDSRDQTRYCVKDVAWNISYLKYLLPICNTFASFWNNSTRITNICNIQMVTHQNCSWSCWTIIPKGTWFWFQEICICFLICFACF